MVVDVNETCYVLSVECSVSDEISIGGTCFRRRFFLSLSVGCGT